LAGARQPIANDFVNVWAAGRLVLDGHAAAAYDWTLHREVEVAAVGHEFEGYYSWHYPPTVLFVAAALASLPYLVAALIWLAVTLPAYVAAGRAIVGERIGILLACAFPGVVWNISAGQNGFLTAALIGGALASLPRRPIIAGILLGLLTYKPQFGLLFPLVLLLEGYWRVLAAAAATAAVMVAASFALGTEADAWALARSASARPAPFMAPRKSPDPSLRAKRSNPESAPWILDCFVGCASSQ
jgi:hypothetical protein